MSLKHPPTFSPEEGDDYVNWKKDAEVWALFTTEAKSKHGAAIYLSLKGTARDAVRGITSADLQKETGLEEVVKLLDAVYLKDIATQAFCAFKDFVDYRRSSGDSFSTFIVEFEKRNREIIKHEMKLPTGAQAYFLLQAANLTSENERLARATATLDYDSMKTQIQKVFGETIGNVDETLPVKTEEANYTRGFQGQGSRGRGRSMSQRTRMPFQRRGGFSQNWNTAGSASSGSNPLNPDGTVPKCYECGSTSHFIKDCPQRRSSRSGRRPEEANMTVNITLFSGEGSAEQCMLMAESIGFGILDSACTKTVAGEQWMKEFLSVLPESEYSQAKESERKNKSVYRFGDGKETHSLRTIDLPVMIGSKKYIIEVDVVASDIPLLISKPSMSRLGMKIDFSNNQAEVCGEIMSLRCTTSGHYCIPLSYFVSESCNFVFNIEHLCGSTVDEKKKKALKLHRQFCHASSERLIRLLKNAGCSDKDFIQEIEKCCQNCEFCRKYKAPLPRPVVGFPMAEEFNQVVCMDLKEVKKGKLWILHLVDAATRYTNAVLINTKRKEVVVNEIFQNWIKYFGSPVRFHSDNGGEFANETFTDMTEMIGVEISTTPAEAPFSNGIVERANKILYESMMKTVEDVGCSMELGLAWSVSATNSLQNCNGYAPNQLVMGKNVNLPSLISDKPPAYKSSSTEIVRQHLNAMHSARENFLKADSSRRIRKAFNSQVRTYSEVIYEAGEKVYFKRRKAKGWCGPGKVLGKEGNFVLISQGLKFYRCHPCHLMKVQLTGGNVLTASNSVSSESKKECKKPQQKETGEYMLNLSGSDDDNRPAPAENCDVEQLSQEEKTTDEEESLEEDRSEPETTGEGREEESGSGDTAVSSQVDEEDNEELAPVDESSDDGVEQLMDNTSRPRRKILIEYKLTDGLRGQARVLWQQPKPNSAQKTWVNIREVGTDQDSSLNWDQVLWWRQKDSEQVLVLSKIREDDVKISKAKEKEMMNLLENDVFEWVSDHGQKKLSCKWVITEKVNDEGDTATKARLVARGFEERLLSSDVRTDSPTCTKTSLRMVFIAASTMSWELRSLDITSAFLQGDKIERNVHINPPPEAAEHGKIWRLNRSLYGLCDAPRNWYKRVVKELQNFGGVASKFDKALFLWHNDSSLMGILALHVDDFVYGGSNAWSTSVMQKLEECFKISKTASGSFRYVGLNVIQTTDTIQVDQNDYVKDLKPLMLTPERALEKDDVLSVEEKQNLRSINGQFQWLSTNTRPDIAFDTCISSNNGKSPTVENALYANKIVRKLQKDDVHIAFPALGDPKLWKLAVHGDASHANLPNGSSQGAYVVFLVGGQKMCPVVWKSKKLDRVTKSPLASEISAIADAADAGFYVKSIVEEIWKTNCKIDVYTDSDSLRKHISTTNQIDDLRLRVDTARLREMVEEQEIDLKWVPSKKQLADSLTKYNAPAAYLLKTLMSGVNQLEV